VGRFLCALRAVTRSAACILPHSEYPAKGGERHATSGCAWAEGQLAPGSAPGTAPGTLLTACAPATTAAPTALIPPGAGSPTDTASTPSTCTQASCGATGVQVFVEPQAGEPPVVHAIEGATRTVWAEVYILTDRTVVHALEDAAGRGVDVRVLLESHPFGEGDVQPARMLEELSAAGLQARPADPAYHYTHARALVVDHQTAYQRTRLSAQGLRASLMKPGDVEGEPAQASEGPTPAPRLSPQDRAGATESL
jgi:hypothetical protein